MIVRLPTHQRRARLFVAADAVWFRLPGQPAINLRRRGALRRLIAKLMDLRKTSPGAALPMVDAFEVGWPGERAIPRAAATRVYTAIHELRAMGLEGMLLRRHGGYVLDADIYVMSEPNGLESEIPPAMPLDKESARLPLEELEPIPVSA